MPITLGNPIVITSGTQATVITQRGLAINKIYWLQPTLESTSNLVIRKSAQTGAVLTNMKCETSGQSQVLDFEGAPVVRGAFVDMVPTGTLYIYTK